MKSNFEFTSLLNIFNTNQTKELLEDILEALKLIKPKIYRHDININNYLLIEIFTKYSRDITINELNFKNNFSELLATLTYYISILKPFSCSNAILGDFNNNNEAYSDFVTCYNEIILSYIIKLILAENNIQFKIKYEKYFIISLKYNKLSINALKLIYDSMIND
ncbi:hypothetical protein SZ52_00465 [Brachyspira hyodysenteriae]|uniref:hypothetical protein n=1 Tax=Brachyspira hyodysenteriae TaxID=159 RepID=UPI00063D917B|nr:hypothetical protein [Brachyspira hyodysenteriae]KLI44811.1 hypothetical protein SZ52_00465 [Brachyspira hyodysenteriae]